MNLILFLFAIVLIISKANIPMLYVYEVLSITSGNLSLPYKVN